MKDAGQEEGAVIGRAKGGDAGAFRELVLRYQEDAFRAAMLILRDAGEAEDATQEAFIRAHAALSRFKEGRPFRPWILRIAVNQALTMLKRRRRRAEVPLEVPGEGTGYRVDEAVIARERAAQLSNALNQVREKERAIIYLRYFLHLNEQEMAQYLDCRPGTVKSRLHRALAKLGDIVQRRYPHLLEDDG